MTYDGSVKIQIDVNGKEAAKELDAVDKSFKKTEKSGERVTTVYGNLEREAQGYIEKLRVMALGGDKSSKEFQRLAQHVRDLKTTLNDANKAVDKATGGFDAQANGMNKLAGFAKSLIATYISFAGAVRAAQFAMQSVQAFREQERAVASLNNALMNAGAYSYQYSQSIQELASEIQKYSNYGDEAVIKAQALGQAYIGKTKITKELTKATVDFAAATGMDLEQAFALVGKSVGSQTNALARYGIQLQKGMSDTQKMDAITKQLSDRYAGQAKVMADGTIQLKNVISDLSESIGRTLDPSVNTATNLFIKWAESAKKLADSFYNARAELHKLNLEQSKDRISQLQAKQTKYEKLLADLETSKMPITGKRITTTAPQLAFFGVHLTESKDTAIKKTKQQIALIKHEILDANNHIGDLIDKNTELEKQSKSRGYKLTDDFGISGVGGGSSSVQKAKDAYEKLQEAVEKAQRKVYNLSTAKVVNIEAVRQAKLEYDTLKSKFDEVQNSTNGAYTQLTNHFSTLQTQLRDAFSDVNFDPEKLKNLVEEYRNTKDQINEIDKEMTDSLGKDWDKLNKDISNTLGNTIVSALKGSGNALETFGNLAENILQRILNKLIEIAIVEPIINSISGMGWFKKITSFFGSAKGNVFQNGKVVPMANGGIVNKPTIFPMANGGTGLMGEAGAEAVMPLRRMSNGRLGVEASDKDAVQVNIFNQSNAQIDTRKRDNGSMDIIIKQVNEALMNERTSMGFRAAYQREDNKGLQAV